MPNWCENDLIIKGPEKVVILVLKSVRGHERLPLEEVEALNARLFEIGKETLEAQDIKKRMKTYGEKMDFDFNQIVPMPDSLDVKSGSVGDEALVAFYQDEAPAILGKASTGCIKSAMKHYGIAKGKNEIQELQAALLKENPRSKWLADTYYNNHRAYGCKTWYEWCPANWGTKWNACEVSISRKKGNALVSFHTAWSPPVPIIKALGKKFPLASFSLKYYEGGAGFQGELVVKRGETSVETQSDYNGNRGG